MSTMYSFIHLNIPAPAEVFLLNPNKCNPLTDMSCYIHVIYVLAVNVNNLDNCCQVKKCQNIILKTRWQM